MSTFLVGYDLNAPGQNYDDLITHLKTYPNWWHHLDSTWLIVANVTAAQLRDRVKQYLDSGDELLVIDVSGDSSAWSRFSKQAGDWIKANL